MKWMWAFSKDQKGATAIEYGLIAALIAVASIAAMIAFTLEAIVSGSAPSSRSLVPMSMTTPDGSRAKQSSARRRSITCFAVPACVA